MDDNTLLELEALKMFALSCTVGAGNDYDNAAEIRGIATAIRALKRTDQKEAGDV